MQVLEAGEFVYPGDVFVPEGFGDEVLWTCVRTRARWEKKLARWLAARHTPFFLPTYARQSTSHRKTRVSHLPLIPGYVFVRGHCDKTDLKESFAVAGILQPQGEGQIRQLHRELWNIWRGLVSGSHLELTQQLAVGQWVQIVSGPLKGMEGRFERWSSRRRLILTIDMLGAGVALEVPDNCTTVPL